MTEIHNIYDYDSPQNPPEGWDFPENRQPPENRSDFLNQALMFNFIRKNPFFGFLQELIKEQAHLISVENLKALITLHPLQSDTFSYQINIRVQLKSTQEIIYKDLQFNLEFPRQVTRFDKIDFTIAHQKYKYPPQRAPRTKIKIALVGDPFMEKNQPEAVQIAQDFASLLQQSFAQFSPFKQ
jgi:hypothetical protein